MRGTPTLGPYSRTDSSPGRLTDSGSTLIAPDTPSMSKVSTTAHRVSPGQIPITRHLLRCRGLAYPSFPRWRESQGWRGSVPVFTGTTSGRTSLPPFPPNQNFASPSFPRRQTPAQPSFPPHTRHSRDGGNPGVEGMGSRLHGNDGRYPVSDASPPTRREYIVSAFTRTGRRRASRRRSRSGAAPPCPPASPARRRRRIGRASARSCRSAYGSRLS